MYALTTIRARLGSVMGTFVALALGVALIGATALAMLSNVARTPNRFSVTPAVVYRDGPPFSLAAADSLASDLSSVAGVAQVIPDYSFYAQPWGSEVIEGHGWSDAAWQGRLQGDPPADSSDVVAGRSIGAAPGSVVTIFTSAGPAEYRVTGVVDGEGLYFAAEVARNLTSGVAAIGLVVAPGTDLAQLRQRLAGVVGDTGRVLIGDERSALESTLDSGRRDGGSILLGTMAAISGFVSVFVVSSTFALSVAQRRREFGLLRSVGATPGQIRRMLLGEALAIGVCAAGCGAMLAVPLAPVLGRMLERANLVATGFTSEIAAWPLAGAAGVGILVALLGAWSASRRAGKVAALEALRTSIVETRAMTPARWLFGILFLLAGLGLSVGSVPSGTSAVLNAAAFVAMALITGIALLAPVIIPPVAYVMAWPFTRLRGATGILVRENTLIAVRRTASTAAPILVTVGFAALVTGVIATFGVATRQDGLLDARGDVVVLPASTVGLSDAAVAAVPDGESLLMSNVYVNHPDGYQQEVEVAGVSADVLMRNGLTLAPGEIAIAQHYADWLGWRVGSTVPVTFADGVQASVRVVAITDDIDDDALAGGAVLPRATVREHDRSALTEVVFLDGADVDTLNRGLDDVGAVALGAEAYAEARTADEERLARLVILVLVGLSLAFTSIAIVNTLLMATNGRLRDFAVLRLSGATTRQIIGMVAAETTLVVTIAATLGTAVALVAVAAIAWALTKDVGVAIPTTMDWPVLSLVILACLVLALLASVVSARLALRGGAAALAGSPE